MIIGEPASLWTSGAVVYICYNNRHVLYRVLSRAAETSAITQNDFTHFGNFGGMGN